MSKVYDQYLTLKKKDQEKKYLFKLGIFYIFLQDDAKEMADLLGFKLTNFNDTVVKCGFPSNAIDKYIKVLDEANVPYVIVDKGQDTSNRGDYIKNVKLEGLLGKIKKIEVNDMTPMQAFQTLLDLKEEVEQL